MTFIKKGKANLKPRRRTFGSLQGKHILIVVILAMAMAEGANATRAPEARVIADYSQIRSEAEIIYEKENSYLNVNCNYGNIKILCDDIEKYSGMKSIIHSSVSEYCAYGRISKDREFHGEYYGSYWCVDSTLASKFLQYIDPGSTSYCTGASFRCPDKDGLPSRTRNQMIGAAIDKFKALLPMILSGVGFVSGLVVLFWNYLRIKKGKRRLPFLGVIGVTLLVASILWFLIIISLGTAR